MCALILLIARLFLLYLKEWQFFIILGFSVLALNYLLFLFRKTKRKRKRVKIDKYLAEQKKKEEEWHKEYQNKLLSIEQEYGKITLQIDDPIWNRVDSLYVCEESKTILLKGKPYNFNEIISYTLEDDYYVLKGGAVATSKTANSDMLSRAVVGGVLAGGTGALIGGATAKKETVIQKSEDVVRHRYYINITVNRLSEPLIKMYLGVKSDDANKAASVLRVIINQRG